MTGFYPDRMMWPDPRKLGAVITCGKPSFEMAISTLHLACGQLEKSEPLTKEQLERLRQGLMRLHEVVWANDPDRYGQLDRTAWELLEQIPAINDLGSQFQEDIQSAILAALKWNTGKSLEDKE